MNAFLRVSTIRVFSTYALAALIMLLKLLLSTLDDGRADDEGRRRFPAIRRMPGKAPSTPRRVR